MDKDFTGEKILEVNIGARACVVSAEPRDLRARANLISLRFLRALMMH